MRKSYPVEFTAELRGIQPAMQFTARDTGELVDLAPTLQLESAQTDGSVELHHVRLSDRLVTTLKNSDFVRGLVVRVKGDAVISDGGKSYFKYLAVDAA
jgi:hypothetical protein